VARRDGHQPASRRRSGVNRYLLPPEQWAFLTRAAGADNIAVFTQYISLLGSVEDDIVECFKNVCGVPYAKFRDFTP